MNDGFTNIVSGGLDSGIRLGESVDGSMVAVPETPGQGMAIVGSPAYFEGHGLPKAPADLQWHTCLAYRLTNSSTIDRWSFTTPDAGGRTIVFAPQRDTVCNDEGMLRAALQGVGLMLHVGWRLRKQLSEGRWYASGSNGVRRFRGSFCMA